MSENAPLRGEVWLTSFDPSIGGETRKTRPALVLSNDLANNVLNRVQVVPMSSQLRSIYPAEAVVTLNGQRRKAMGDQITTVAKERLLRRLGVLPEDDVAAVVRVVCIQLYI